MKPRCVLILSALTVAMSSIPVAAQSVSHTPPVTVQVLEPRNKLEEFETRLETVLVRGTTNIGTVSARSGSIRVQAVEIQDLGKSERVTGIELTINPAPKALETLMDYEEIDALISGLDTVAKANESVTKLTRFRVGYRSKEDFEVAAFKLANDNLVVVVSNDAMPRVSIQMNLDEVAKLRYFILQAKATLDEIK